MGLFTSWLEGGLFSTRGALSFWSPCRSCRGCGPSERGDLESSVETRGIPSDPEDLADRTGPADRGDSPADLALGVSTNSVPARVSFAVQGRLIGRPGSVDLDRLLVGAVAKAVDGAFEGRRRDTKAN